MDQLEDLSIAEEPELTSEELDQQRIRKEQLEADIQKAEVERQKAIGERTILRKKCFCPSLQNICLQFDPGEFLVTVSCFNM